MSRWFHSSRGWFAFVCWNTFWVTWNVLGVFANAALLPVRTNQSIFFATFNFLIALFMVHQLQKSIDGWRTAKIEERGTSGGYEG